MPCKVKHGGSHVKGRCEDTQGAVPISYPWCGRLCYKIPPSTIIATLLLELHSLSKQAGQSQTAVIKPQRCTLELVLVQPGGLHTGQKHHRAPNPTTD